MQTNQINNIEELRAEIARLKIAEQYQNSALKKRMNSPSAAFATLITSFSKKEVSSASASPRSIHPDLIRLASRFLIPFTLNKTLFKNSNFIVKFLVDLVSQKAAKFVSEPVAGNVLTKFKSMWGNLTRKKPNQPIKVISSVRSNDINLQIIKGQ